MHCVEIILTCFFSFFMHLVFFLLKIFKTIFMQQDDLFNKELSEDLEKREVMIGALQKIVEAFDHSWEKHQEPREPDVPEDKDNNITL